MSKTTVITKAETSLLLLVFLLLGLVTGRGETATVDFQELVIKKQGIFNGQTINYMVVIEKIPVADGEKGLSADIVSIAYIGDKVGDPSNRPVIFLFNGGPIVPSVFLHVGAFGPKRVEFSDDLGADPETFTLVDNEETVIDQADLVFFDPAGTGFSRVGPGISPDAYFSVEADARQLRQFIESWSRRHGRLPSPKYLFGESYGTIRAAIAAEQLTDITPHVRLDGLFLLGQALNIIETSNRPGNIIGYVVSLPTQAALGWYHGLVNKQGRTLEQFLDEVKHFARTEYLTALFEGNNLTEEKKVYIAQKLAAFTGLPCEIWLQNQLKIRKIPFRSELLKFRNEVIGYYDGRYTVQSKEGQIPDASSRISEALVSGFKKYAQEDLNLDLADYIINSPVKDLEDWGWGGKTPFSDWPYMESIRKAMEKNPRLRVIVAAGYYDLTTTIGASEYAIAHSGWPSDRVRLVYYEGGHMPYVVKDSLKKLISDVRKLISTRQ